MSPTVPRRARAALWVAAGYVLNEVLEVAGFEVMEHLLRVLSWA